jgi:hypothetical protein
MGQSAVDKAPDGGKTLGMGQGCPAERRQPSQHERTQTKPPYLKLVILDAVKDPFPSGLRLNGCVDPAHFAREPARGMAGRGSDGRLDVR